MDWYNRGTQGRKGFILPLFILGVCSESRYMLCQGKGAPQFPPLGYLGLPPPSSFFLLKLTWRTQCPAPCPSTPKNPTTTTTLKQWGGAQVCVSYVINAE